MNARKTKKQEQTGFTPRKILLLSIAVLLFSAIISILLTANANSSNRAVQFIRGVLEGKGVVENGMLEIEGVDPIEEVPEGEVRYYINKELVFPNGYAQGDVVLQNPKACGYVLQFRVYLADGSSSQPVYSSPKLRPGQYINGDKLNRYLSGGRYDCTYSVTAYDLADDSVECGSISGFLKIVVMA